jgi:hypothetical protein
LRKFVGEISGSIKNSGANRKEELFSFLLMPEAFFVCLIKYRALLHVANKELDMETHYSPFP